MSAPLGMPLDAALAAYKAAGKSVSTVEVACRKGGAGDDLRVIKAAENADAVVLYWARFQTTVRPESNQAN